MLRVIYLNCLILCSTQLFANEQIIEIKNNLDVDTLENEERKYAEIIDDITNDMKNNGFYFKIGGKKISPDDKSYSFEISDIDLYVKRSVFDRNRKKAQAIKSKSLFQSAINKNGYRYLIGTDLNQPKICFRMDIKNKNKETIDSHHIMPLENFPLFYFIQPKYWSFQPNQFLLDRIKGKDDIKIPLWTTKVSSKFELKQIGTIQAISFRQIFCKPLG